MGKRIMRSSVDGPVESGDVVLCGRCRRLVGCPPVGAVLLDVRDPGTRIGSEEGRCVLVCSGRSCGALYVFDNAVAERN